MAAMNNRLIAPIMVLEEIMKKAEFWSFFGKWAALSQYGYVLSWHASEAEAIAAHELFYASRQHLLN